MTPFHASSKTVAAGAEARNSQEMKKKKKKKHREVLTMCGRAGEHGRKALAIAPDVMSWWEGRV